MVRESRLSQRMSGTTTSSANKSAPQVTPHYSRGRKSPRKRSFSLRFALKFFAATPLSFTLGFLCPKRSSTSPSSRASHWLQPYRIVSTHPDARVVALAEVSPERARSADKFGVPDLVTDTNPCLGALILT
jgi:hypothetical protein